MRRHVYFFTHFPGSFTEMALLLGGDPAAWLPLPARPEGDRWVVRLSSDGALPGPVSSREASVDVGPTQWDHGDTLVRSLLWKASSADWLFPVMEAELELASLGGSGCRLTFTGTYRPPLSVLGGAGDRLVGHRAAEGCVRRFVLDVASRLQGSTLPV